MENRELIIKIFQFYPIYSTKINFEIITNGESRLSRK